MRIAPWCGARSSALALILGLSASAAPAQQLTVGQGASLSLGSGTLEVGCRDLQVSGSLDMAAGTLAGARHVSASGAVLGGSGTLALSGDLDAAGALAPQSGTVRSEDGCGSAATRIQGAHAFFRLIAQTDVGRSLVLPAGQTQNIASRLELAGGAARLIVRSSTPGALALMGLPAAGTWAISRIDVQDVGMTPDSPFVGPQDPSVYDSIDRGNTPRLLGADMEVVPVPALSNGGLFALLLGIAGLGMLLLNTRHEGKV